jgi:Putative MetA-pathway of phenol degradation
MLLTIFAVLCAGTPGWSQELEHFVLKIGSSYDQGDYGSPDLSRVLYTPITLRYMGTRFDIGVTPSYALVNSTGGVSLIDGVPTRTGTATSVRETRSGVGDTIVRSRFYLLQDGGPNSPVPSLTPFAKVKVPTSKQDLNLGTGKADVGFGVELDKQISRLLVFGDVGYTFVGKTPQFDLQNRPNASFGLGGRVTETVVVSGSLDWRRSIIRGNADPTELVGTVSYRLSPTVTVTPNVFVGLTNSTSDFGAGIEFAFRFGRY